MATSTHRNALAPGYRLHWYTIERILGQGGFGITYLATDSNLEQKVAVKEYLPSELAVREGDFSVHPVSDEREGHYHWGLERFIGEARALAQFDHPNICRVLTVFESNNTAYMVMRYEEGESLAEVLSRRPTLPENELLGILFPILDGLGNVHEHGFIHRDIKPANVFIRTDGSPVLIDFGSARRALGEETRTLTTLVSPGYAPFEQYHAKSDKQGPWTDIYGLAATIYRAATGKPPMEAVERSTEILANMSDRFPWAASVAAGRYSPGLLRVLDRGLRFDAGERPQSIAEWKSAFESALGLPDTADTAALSHAATAGRAGSTSAAGPMTTTLTVAMDARAPAPGARPPGRRAPWLIVALIAVAAGAALWSTSHTRKPRQPSVATAPGTSPPHAQESAAPAPAATQPDTAPSPVPETKPPPPALTEIEITEPAARDTALAPKESTQDRIRRLLDEAALAMESQDYTSPAGDNAFERYWEVLHLDSHNDAAMQGVRAIVEHQVSGALHAHAQKNPEQALRYIGSLTLIVPESRVLAKVRQRLR